ncbi:MAG: hypothetical protein G01um10147_1106 [Microgenomates group bacterium Gr01-1014_7]|nr:MAG: hypothetical protein G01um10147_1106 [Microgenomates group bacterium Gr01-1014_7]
MDESTPVVKKTTRTRKTVSTQPDEVTQEVQSQTTVMQNFDELVAKLIKSKQEFDSLQKEIAQMKIDSLQQKAQEELERKRERETYDYSTTLDRKRAEDEFEDKKLAWEKDLAQRKDELEAQRRELDELRKLVSDFDNQKEKAVIEAKTQIGKQLTDQFDQERKLKEQEVKADKEILGLKIANLEGENSRLVKEMEAVKRLFDEANRQVKEIAVKVIESGQPKVQVPSD